MPRCVSSPPVWCRMGFRCPRIQTECSLNTLNALQKHLWCNMNALRVPRMPPEWSSLGNKMLPSLSRVWTTWFTLLQFAIILQNMLEKKKQRAPGEETLERDPENIRPKHGFSRNWQQIDVDCSTPKCSRRDFQQQLVLTYVWTHSWNNKNVSATLELNYFNV